MINVPQSHEILAQLSLTYLLHLNMKLPVDFEAGRLHAYEEFPFLHYAATSWGYHYSQAQVVDRINSAL